MVTEKKITSITFFRHDCLDKEELLRFTEKMIKIIQEMKLQNVKECVIKKGESAPMELWLHDFQNKETPMQPFRKFYIIEHDDGSLKVVLLLDEVQAPEQIPAPMMEPPRVEMYG